MIVGNWEALVRTLITAVLVYAGLVFLLRISGKRTLSQWNAFDFVVTVALGSTLATAMLSNDVSVFQGMTAFLVLVGLQFLVTWLSVRFNVVQKIVKDQPTLLVYKGQFRREVMKRVRVPESEIRAALRGHGIASVEEAAAVVLETDGRFSILRELGTKPPTAMKDVEGFEAHHERG